MLGLSRSETEEIAHCPLPPMDASLCWHARGHKQVRDYPAEEQSAADTRHGRLLGKSGGQITGKCTYGHVCIETDVAVGSSDREHGGHMRLKDALYYGAAAVLFLATVPIYRYILGHARADVAREETLAHAPQPRPTINPAPDFAREFCWTKRVRGTCAYIAEAEAALASGKARCLGGLVMVMRKEGETTVVEEWPHRTQCYY